MSAEERSLVYHTLFRDGPDAVFVNDDQARFVDANAAACALVGYSYEELIGLTVWDVTPPAEHPAGQQTWQRLLQKRVIRVPYTLARRDGTPVPVDVMAIANAVPGLHAGIVRETLPAEAQREAALALGRQQERDRLLRSFQDEMLDWLRREGAPLAPDPLAALTPRDRQIMLLIAEGKTNPQIAAALGVSVHTVKACISGLLKKFHLPHRAALAALATCRGGPSSLA